MRSNQLTFRRKPSHKRKPYVWRFLADWESHGWNGVSYTGTERWQKDVPLQRIAFTVNKPHPTRRVSRVDSWLRRTIRRYRPAARLRYTKMLLTELRRR